MHRYQVLRTCGVHAGTHTRVTPYTWQREAQEWPFSLCWDRTRYRSRDFCSRSLRKTELCADHCEEIHLASPKRTINDCDRQQHNRQESIGDFFAKRNDSFHHRLFLFLCRITVPGVADDDTPGWVQACQVLIVKKYIILVEYWKKWHRGRRNYFLRRKIASKLGK